ncbi:unnamed protein product, partial [Phaeothamnion confervicola]
LPEEQLTYSQVDPHVLAELPPDIRWEVEQEMRARSKPAGKKPASTGGAAAISVAAAGPAGARKREAAAAAMRTNPATPHEVIVVDDAPAHRHGGGGGSGATSRNGGDRGGVGGGSATCRSGTRSRAAETTRDGRRGRGARGDGSHKPRGPKYQATLLSWFSRQNFQQSIRDSSPDPGGGDSGTPS